MGHTTRPISDKDLRRLLRELDEPDKLAVMICADTGLRISDILRIKPGDLAPTMRVTESKTGKTRTVHLRKATLDAARRYARYSGKYLIDSDRSTIYRHVHGMAAELGLKDISMHSIRKYYARRYYRAHGLAQTQRELKHDYLSTTLLYLVDPDNITGE